MQSNIEDINLIKKLNEKCDEGLSEEFIEKKKGDKGYDVKYISNTYVIKALNQTFGALGWSRESLGHEVLSVEKTTKKDKRTGKEIPQVNVIVSCKMRLKIHPNGMHNGIFASYDDIGTGSSYAAKEGVAKDQALKSAYTDAIKRCVTTLGYLFGLGLRLDYGTAKKNKAIVRSTRDNNILAAKKDDAGNERSVYDWVSSETYSKMKHFLSRNKKSESVTTDIRNSVFNEAKKVYSDTFRCSEESAEEVFFKIMESKGVYSSGLALPKFSTLVEFMKNIDEELKGERESSILYLDKKKIDQRNVTVGV